MADRAAYDRIGATYSATRRPDPRVRDAIWSALGCAATVINVGAGTGSYEPPETVLAVEPSQVMIDQRPPGAAPAVAAGAEHLPVPDGFADAAMALLTVHHWRDVAAGIAELHRVARRIVILTWDQRVTERFWLSREYLPSSAPMTTTPSPSTPCSSCWAAPRCARCPSPTTAATDSWAVLAARVPRSGRARRHLHHGRHRATLGPGLERLRVDLESGEWDARHADLLRLDQLDLGYRLLISVS
jgi:SAM-dependent methyltransferase